MVEEALSTTPSKCHACSARNIHSMESIPPIHHPHSLSSTHHPVLPRFCDLSRSHDDARTHALCASALCRVRPRPRDLDIIVEIAAINRLLGGPPSPAMLSLTHLLPTLQLWMRRRPHPLVHSGRRHTSSWIVHSVQGVDQYFWSS